MKKQRQQSTIANTYETSYLNSDPISFPFPETTGLPVINTSTGELIYLYFPRAEYNFINIEVKPENRTVFRDTEIIKKLRQAREENNISIKDIANKVNVTRQTISNIENYTSMPSIALLCNIAASEYFFA